MTLTSKHTRSGFCSWHDTLYPQVFVSELLLPLGGTLLGIDEALRELPERSSRTAAALAQT